MSLLGFYLFGQSNFLSLIMKSHDCADYGLSEDIAWFLNVIYVFVYFDSFTTGWLKIFKFFVQVPSCCNYWCW